MNWTWYEWTTNTITVVGIVWSVVFIVDYWRLSRGLWIHNEYGRFFMAFPSVMFLLLLFVLVARNVVENIDVRRVVGIVLYCGLVVTIPWLHRLMRISMRRNTTHRMPRKDG